VRIVADGSGGLEKAIIKPCNTATSLTFGPGTDYILTCSSISITVKAGTVEGKFVSIGGDTSLVNIDSNNGIEFDSQTSTYIAPH
jgi:hypothetical protein